MHYEQTDLDFIYSLQNCLGTIYTVYIENLPYALENLIGNILGCIQVPQPGGPQVRFSIGAGDKQSLQPPQSPSLPVTGTAVYFVFKQLGMQVFKYILKCTHTYICACLYARFYNLFY